MAKACRKDFLTGYAWHALYSDTPVSGAGADVGGMDFGSFRRRCRRDSGSDEHRGGVTVSLSDLSGVLSLIGTLFGTFGGILVSSKLTAYRIEQLEKKVDKHNHFAERLPVIEEQIRVINHRISDLEKEND